jgi:hypothetical protein
MKVLKNVFLVVGLLVVIGAGAMAGVVTLFYLPDLVRVALDNSMGQPPLTDPTGWVLIGIAAGVVGGVLVGLGIGLPSRTANALRHDTIEELHRQTTADAAVAARAGTEPVTEPVTEPRVDPKAVTEPQVDPKAVTEPRTEPTA